MPAAGKRLKPEILAVTVGGADFQSQLKTKASKRGAKTLKIPGLSIMDVCALVHRKGG